MFSPSAIHRQRFQKVTLIFLFFFLSVALIITWNTPATGYESSIYRSTPLILWVSLIASVIAGVTLVVIPIAKNELDQSPLWKIGFLLVFLSYVVCLALFIIRGYYMWCMFGDPGEHIGWIKATLDTGHAPRGVIYPIIHIFLSETVFLTGLDLVILHKIVPVIFSALFILYMYVFAKTVFSNTAMVLLAGIVSCTIFTTDFYLNLIPSGLSSLLLPLVLFVIFKYLHQRRLAWAVLLSILVVLYPVFHPVSTIFIELVFLTLWIPHTVPEIAKCIHKRKITFPDPKNYILKLILPFLVILTWFIFWISSFRVWGNTVRSIFQTVFSEGTPSEAMALLDTVSYAHEYGYSVIEQVFKQYGVVMVLFGLSVLAVLLLLKNLHYDRYNKSLLSLLGPFGVLSIVIPVLFLFDLPFNAFRFLHALMILMSTFSAYALYNILTYKRETSLLRGTTFASVFVIVIISGLFLGSLFNLYPSPYNLGMSYHNTDSEVAGMEHIYDYRDVTTPLSGITVAPGRFADALLTPKERAIHHIPMYLKERDRVPWRFGYDIHSSLSSVYDKEIDLIIIQKDKALYTDVLPDMAQHRFTKQDFERLKIDPGVDAIYSNGEFDFFKVTMMF
jgi:hypothetical protein